MSSSDPIDPLVSNYVERLTDVRPLVIINITGGVEQWTITDPGHGEPDVHIFDFDDEMDLEDLENTLARWAEVIGIAEDRVPAATLANMIETRNEMFAKVHEIKEEIRESDERDQSTSKRERAAALLTDAEINGILDAHST